MMCVNEICVGIMRYVNEKLAGDCPGLWRKLTFRAEGSAHAKFICLCCIFSFFSVPSIFFLFLQVVCPLFRNSFMTGLLLKVAKFMIRNSSWRIYGALIGRLANFIIVVWFSNGKFSR